MVNARENDKSASPSTHGADAARLAIQEARTRAKHERAERERRPIEQTNPTYTTGAALVRAALEKARKP